MTVKDIHIVSIIEKIRRGKVFDEIKPHKDILLCALIEMYELSSDKNNCFYLSEKLERIFEKYWKQYVPNIPFASSLIEIPFYYLQGDRIWRLVLKPNCKKRFLTYQRITKKRILECVDYAEFEPSFFEIVADSQKREILKQALFSRLSNLALLSNQQATSESSIMSNLFVSYLNSLHCADAGSKGALAEAQSREPLFCEIHVSHPWNKEIFNSLTGANCARVILSGHAGDGKSTLAVEIIKRLRGIPNNQQLSAALGKREETLYNGHTVIVVKDLSEWTKDEQQALFSELLENSGRRYLVVSNTGALLDFFKANAENVQETPIELENALLTALDASEMRKMEIGEHLFHIYNLAQCDNISLAMNMFDKMVQSVQWENCGSCPQHDHCPIAANLQVLRKYRELVQERLKLLYSRAYAYGARLTMRQIGAHFAYLLTGGTDCKKVTGMFAAGKMPQPVSYSFVNRFWGDDGVQEDKNAAHLQAVKVFRDECFNTRVLPSQERKFWSTAGNGFTLNVPEMEETLRSLEKDVRKNSSKNSASAARREIRRLAYFLFNPDAGHAISFRHFLCTFLNSPKILDIREWKENPGSFKARDLQTPLFCVLQEQFCGIRPPEGNIRDWELYLTLNRQNSDIRQSSQLVLRHFRFLDKFDIKLVDGEPYLIGKNDLNDVSLPLTLPFLDYIIEQKSGRLGRGLQLAYRNRLENLMAQILKKLPNNNEGAITLLKQSEDGSLATISVRKNEQTLEVLQ